MYPSQSSYGYCPITYTTNKNHMDFKISTGKIDIAHVIHTITKYIFLFILMVF